MIQPTSSFALRLLCYGALLVQIRAWQGLVGGSAPLNLLRAVIACTLLTSNVLQMKHRISTGLALNH